MNEITKQVAINAYKRHFDTRGLNHVKENFVKAYKINRVYAITYRFKSTVQIMLFGGVNQHLCLSLNTFKSIQSVDMKAVEILFKGDKDA